MKEMNKNPEEIIGTVEDDLTSPPTEKQNIEEKNQTVGKRRVQCEKY